MAYEVGAMPQAETLSEASMRTLLAKLQDIPPIVFTKKIGPRSARLRRRTNILLLCVLLIGLIPNVLVASGLIQAAPAVQTFGWGLWLPGAGFLAAGGWATIGFPISLLLFFASLIVWSMSGMLVLPLAIWLGSAVAAAFTAGDHVATYAPAAVPIATAAFFLVQALRELRLTRAEVARGKVRSGYLDTAVSALAASTASAAEPSARELSPDALAAARYMLDLALQPVGSFNGFTLKDNVQLAALRYQLNYISYGLAGLQCKYTPSFHGYLSKAQRFAIEALTEPRVCGYWKWESMWGGFKWNPDPVCTDNNIMFTGWSLIGMSTYAANTGDLRYQKEGALQFRPFKGRDVSYAHNAHSFVESLQSNWNQCPLYLYPCEPHWSFPICNALAFCGMVPHDRVNGTNLAAGMHGQFWTAMEEEFLLPDGGARAVMSSLTGWSSLSRTPPEVEFAFLLWMARTTNAIHPGYAKRWYSLARHEFTAFQDGGLVLKGIDWNKCLDTGNYKRNPGFALANIALAAREHGDDTTAEAALRKADELLVRVADNNIYAFDAISTSANLNLAAARWYRKNDWHDLINRGPEKSALRGPILTDCKYPDVLVARAVSNGEDLELVLYNGGAPGPQKIRLERLRPGGRYLISGDCPRDAFQADNTGCVELSVGLTGRTAVTVSVAR